MVFCIPGISCLVVSMLAVDLMDYCFFALNYLGWREGKGEGGRRGAAIVGF